MSKKLTQLDLLALRTKNLVRRISTVEATQEQQVVERTTVDTTYPLSRPNELVNGGFEYYNSGETRYGWTAGTITPSGSAYEGAHVLALTPGETTAQTIRSGANVPQGTGVLSVYTKATADAQKITIAFAHTGGMLPGLIYRDVPDGEDVQSNEIPNDGTYHRFYIQGQFAGGSTLGVTLQNVSASGSIHIDAVKFEFDTVTVGFILPTPFQGSDSEAPTIIRNLRAENILAGTLTVGYLSTNPRIRVLDGAGNEIVLIGDTGSYKGIEIKGVAGAKITGSGSLLVGTAGAQRVEVNASGVAGYDSEGNLQVQLLASTGQLTAGDGLGSVLLARTGLGMSIPTGYVGSVGKITWARNTDGYVFGTIRSYWYTAGTGATGGTVELLTNTDIAGQITSIRVGARHDAYPTPAKSTYLEIVAYETAAAHTLDLVVEDTDRVRLTSTKLRTRVPIEFYDDSSFITPRPSTGVESVKNIYWRSGSTDGVFRWYIGSGPDNGSTEKVELNATNLVLGGVGLQFNGGTLAFGTNLAWSGNLAVPSKSTLTLTNSWVLYGSPFEGSAGSTSLPYSKDANGVVRLHGVVKNGTTTNGTVIGNLPAGFRPAFRRMFASATATAGGVNAHARIDIAANGDIIISGVTTADALSLDVVQFLAGQ